ncbi:hypothetical protein FRB91_005913 [Serendipita sp. 411]|nr:hypothetical protein FRB91_005913 [Serendipita sp. 411]
MPPKFKRPTKPTIKDVTSPTNGDDDDDAFFSRNTKGWKGVTVESISSPTRDKQRSLSSDDEAPMTKKRKRFKEKDSDWTRTDAVIQFEDSDSSIVESAKYPTAVAVRAKKTATASKVLLHYLKKVTEDVNQYDTQGSGKVKKRIKLSFDGEELNPNDQVGKAGAEDDDIWDAIGL